MKEDALVQFKLMIPAGLKGRVEASADRNRRSLSQEIVWVLEKAFPAPKPDIERADIESIRKLLYRSAHVPEIKEAVDELDQVLSRGTENYSQDDLEDLVDYAMSAFRYQFTKHLSPEP